ncbi:hypothetical protein BACCAP_02674 [Pseudoflavonifractor capillosus ATCC 29799]|uniref:Uncharacterized protein n=1 Tax=Pseudoflavonifractor capillosus ATCC 29799 TaxID=411467 RepID=A6NWS9_9FIRM|nr:hypothetical protein BACCAP_02674 [Pseudoflavonifractor capillosus ATCC 29799]
MCTWQVHFLLFLTYFAAHDRQNPSSPPLLPYPASAAKSFFIKFYFTVDKLSGM